MVLAQQSHIQLDLLRALVRVLKQVDHIFIRRDVSKWRHFNSEKELFDRRERRQIGVPTSLNIQRSQVEALLRVDILEQLEAKRCHDPMVDLLRAVRRRAKNVRLDPVRLQQRYIREERLRQPQRLHVRPPGPHPVHEIPDHGVPETERGDCENIADAGILRLVEAFEPAAGPRAGVQFLAEDGREVLLVNDGLKFGLVDTPCVLEQPVVVLSPRRKIAQQIASDAIVVAHP